MTSLVSYLLVSVIMIVSCGHCRKREHSTGVVVVVVVAWFAYVMAVGMNAESSIVGKLLVARPTTTPTNSLPGLGVPTSLFVLTLSVSLFRQSDWANSITVGCLDG